MTFEMKGPKRTELWIGGKYHGIFERHEDALRYVWELATGQLDEEEHPQQKLEWD